MSNKNCSYVVNNIKLPINASFKEAFSVARKKMKNAGITTDDAVFSIYKKSIDARDKEQIYFVYSVIVSGEIPIIEDKLALTHGISIVNNAVGFTVDYGNAPLVDRPVVVGAGPCGLFAALVLAENGYKPIVLERGSSIKERKNSVERFKRFGILDCETNIQFGAGGAGTFSDGKLVTRINDPLSGYVMRRFCDFGAPEEILYLSKPHIGTDILSEIIDKMLEKIKSLGGTIIYNTKYIRSLLRGGKNYALTDRGEIPYGVLILAVGHSARDTYFSLINDNFAIEPKSFSVGMRIEHLAEDIDRAMYGKFANHPNLAHAEYNLSFDTKNRGVYTFCMCPGGEVVAAASEIGGVVVNGMSEHSRAGKNSNSAVVCSVYPEDYGKTPELAINFQKQIEKAAFSAGGSNYSAPIITVGDFLEGKIKTEPQRIQPTYRNGEFTKLVSPDKYLPDFVTLQLKRALVDFDRKIKGFAVQDAILTGAETRTSAPIRILRDPETRLALGQSYIYPCGEGAGYAGGITSAAIDGIKTALAVMKRFKSY